MSNSTEKRTESGSRATFRIAVIPGDGIGQEVTPHGVRVLERLAELSGGSISFEFESFPWGCQHYLATGRMMDEDGLDRLRTFDAIYFGAVGWPGVPDHISLWGLRLAICQGFDQFACVRPVRLLDGIESPLRRGTKETVDWVVVRENSEGEYAGVGGRTHAGRGAGREIATQTAVFTGEGCERIIRYAFETARSRTKKVASVTKSNAQQYAMTLWDDVFARVAADYPDVAAEQYLVDAMAARFILKPESLDVVVGSNLFGDILSDLGSAIGGSLGIAASANLDPTRRNPSMFEPVHGSAPDIAGSLGIAASANLDPTRRNPSMFEPVHGSAPDIAGQGIANPIAAIWTVAMMLEHLGLSDQAAGVMSAIEQTTAAGLLTPDLGGRATTDEVGTAIVEALQT